MKIVGVACSPRKGKTTAYALEECLKALREAQPACETEMIELAEYQFGGCLACGKCMKEFQCSQEDDFSRIIPTLDDPDLAFLDRCVIFRRNGFRFRNKVGGVIAVGGVRNGGQELTIQAVQAALLVWDMVVVSDGQPTSHFGGTVWSGHPDGVEGDTFGLQTVRNLGKRVAELASLLRR
jgi:multimeric flavodoxin WrbA